MKQIKAVAGILAIFALGIMTGALGTDMLIKHRIEMFHKKGPPHIAPMFMKHIGDRLDLTRDQRIEVETILDSLELQLRGIRRGFEPKIRAAFDSAFNRIGECLTEAQKNKMEILRKQFPRYSRQKEPCRRGKRGNDAAKTLPDMAPPGEMTPPSEGHP